MTYGDYIQVWVILVWNSWVDTSMKYLHGIVEVWIQVGIYLYEIFNVQVWDTYTRFFWCTSMGYLYEIFNTSTDDTCTRFLMFEIPIKEIFNVWVCNSSKPSDTYTHF